MLLKVFGAQLELTPASEGTAGSKRRALELRDEIPNSFYIEQHSNPANVRAHRETTGKELWEDTDGKIDIFVAGLGTTGTARGVAEYIKPKKPSFRVVGVEPEIAPMISKGMNAHAARELARMDENRGKFIVAMFADSGERYLSVDGLY